MSKYEIIGLTFTPQAHNNILLLIIFMINMPKIERTTIQMDAPVVIKIEEIAKEQERTRTGYIRLIFKRILEAHDKGESTISII